MAEEEGARERENDERVARREGEREQKNKRTRKVLPMRRAKKHRS